MLPFTSDGFRVGYLHVVRLPPGKYFVVARPINPGIYPLRAERYDFELAGGEAAYLGEYHLDMAFVFETRGHFRDQWGRASALLASKNLALAQVEVRSRVRQVTGEVKYSIPPGYQPVPKWPWP